MSREFMSQDDIDSLLSNLDGDEGSSSENDKKEKVDISGTKVFRGTHSIHSSFNRTYRSPVIEKENLVVNPVSGQPGVRGKTVVWTLDEYQKKNVVKPEIDYTSLISN